MDELKRIITYRVGEYGGVKVKFAELLKSRDITRNRVSTLTGIKYAVVDRYYKAKNIEMVDLDFLARVCFALNCEISDLLEYESPDIQEEK